MQDINDRIRKLELELELLKLEVKQQQLLKEINPYDISPHPYDCNCPKCPSRWTWPKIIWSYAGTSSKPNLSMC